MIHVIPSADRHHADHGWLDTRWHFSFADYHDPDNMNWGPLRVFNDDVIRPGGGFDPHPHRDMEIITYVIDGGLEHQDRLGNRHVNRGGEVQVMSAGRGIVHAEYNASKTDPVRLLQFWILPRNRGIPPRWAPGAFTRDQRHNRWLAVVSPDEVRLPGTLTIDQDATVYVSSLDAGKALEHTQAPGRRAYFFVISGQVTLNGQPLSAGDQARIADETRLSVTATENAELILIDLP